MQQELFPYLKENAMRGTEAFPVGFYTVCFPGHLKDLLNHWHAEIEFTLVRSGQLQYEIDQAPYPVCQGDLIFLGSNLLHGAHQVGSCSAVTDTVVFSLDAEASMPELQCYALPFLNGTRRISPVIRRDSPNYEAFYSIFKALWSCHDPELSCRELLFEQQKLELLKLLWTLQPEPASTATRSFRQYALRLRPALDYLHDHYSEAITISQLASLCGFSQVHFMNTFKAAVGSSCMDYLKSYRLSQAAMELQSTDLPVLQIALACGFPSISYFNRAFKQHYGMTPSAYRQRPL